MRSLKKRIVAMACAAMMAITMLPASYSTTVEAKRVENLDVLSRQAAAEGCVLLKNDNNALPLAEGTKVAVFGRAQHNYIACGEGSGGGVKTDYRITILDGLEKSGKLKIDSELKEKYQQFKNGHDKMDQDEVITDDNFGLNATKDHGKPDKTNKAASWIDMEMSEDEIRNYKNKTDVAIYIIGRTSGEDRDLSFNKGSLLLTDTEDLMLNRISNIYDKVIVVLNTTGIIDMSWVEKYPKIDSVLYAWTGGQEGGHGVADVITGKVNPSGKLTDTIAKNVKDYPTYDNYGVQELHYEEDVYVGYRYFETFAKDKVAYPFGFGLSYTTFETKYQRVEEEDGYLKVVVAVTNTGNVAGKEVVQVYYGAPMNGLGNPAKELAAFAKTRELQPGETETLSLNYKISDMASYDDGGMYQESAYVLEAGEYKIYVGNNVRDCELVYTYNQEKVEITEQLSEACAPVTDTQRYKAVDKNGQITLEKENVPKKHTDVEQRIKDNQPKQFTRKDDKLYSLKDVYEGKLTLEEFVAQMTPEQIGMMAQGSQDVKDGYTSGGASQFGGVRCKDANGKLTYLSDLYGIPVAMTCDGPSGAKISDKCTMIPCGNVLGCTWNLELIEDMYELLGQELVLNEVDSLLGPGINIKRDPRCGRNFEYFSEDPLLAGRLAAVMSKAVQKSGATLTAKHFACNNCECWTEDLSSIRGTADAIISERALREIYLKVFEITVKEGNTRCIMTSYNPINGCWAASNYDLNTTILRNEWGFDGIVMTDWWANMSYQPWAKGDASDKKYSPDERGVMLRAQNDIWMTLDNKVSYDDSGKEQNRNKVSKILRDYENGTLTLAELQRSAYNICNYLLKSQAFARKHNLNFEEITKKYYKTGEEWFTVEQAQLGNPKIEKVTVGGRALTTFNKNVTQYKVFLAADATELPKVEVVEGEGTKIEIEQATADKRTAVIKATEGQATIRYNIVFTDEDGINPILENSVLASLSDIQVDGKSLDEFTTNTYEYSMAVDSLDAEPNVTGIAPEGITVKKTYDATTKTVTLRAISADQAVSYKISFGIAPQSDEFEEAELSKFWIVEDKNDNLKLADGHLTIGAEYGSIWQDQAHLKNRVFQSAAGNWEAVIKIDLPKLPSQPYQSLGVIAMQDYDNYIYVKMAYEGAHLEVALGQEKDKSMSTISKISNDDLAKFTDTMYVKMTKLGNTYLTAVSPDGKEYIEFDQVAFGEYTEPKFMLVNGNGDKDLDEVLEAKFDYVKFNRDLGDVVAIGSDTQIKLAEVAPITRTAALKVTDCQDSDGGKAFSGFVVGEELAYKINVEKTGLYNVNARIASPHEGLEQFRVSGLIDNQSIGQIFAQGTGGDQNWVDFTFGTNVKLTAGEHIFKIHTDDSGFIITFNMNYVQFKMTEEVNDSALQDAIAKAKAKDMSLYTEEEQKAFAEAIKAAETVLASAKSQNEIDVAITALQTAEQTLTPPETEVAKEALSKLIEQETATYNAGQGDYTATSWNQYKAAYEEAQKVLNNANATADELVACNTALTQAKNGLKKNDGSSDNTDTDVNIPDDGNNQGTQTPDDENNQGTQTPGDGNNQGTQNPDDGDNQGNQNSGTQTPGDGNNQGTQTPGDGNNQGTQTPGDGNNQGTQNPGDGNNQGTQTPGDGNNQGAQNGNNGQTGNNNSGTQNGNNGQTGNNNSGTQNGNNDQTGNNNSGTQNGNNDQTGNNNSGIQNGNNDQTGNNNSGTQNGNNDQTGNNNSGTQNGINNQSSQTGNNGQSNQNVNNTQNSQTGNTNQGNQTIINNNPVNTAPVIVYENLDDVMADIITHDTNKDITNSVYGSLSLCVKKSSQTSVKLKWNKVSGATGYLVFAGKIGDSMDQIKDIKKGNTTSYTQSKLKKGSYYKYIVVAYKTVDGKKVSISTSKMIYAATTGGVLSEIKSIAVNKSKISLQTGLSFKLKASEIKKDNKKNIKHYRKISFESSNPNVATVSKSGKITAKGTGTCKIYVYAQNGVCKKVTVTVN